VPAGVRRLEVGGDVEAAETLETICEASRDRYEALREGIRRAGSALVAFSGGVDSTFVLKVALDVLGPKAVALTAISPSVAPREREAAVRIARALGAEHVLVDSSELDDPRYAANPTDRCYFCKSELYDLCARVAAERGIAAVLDGFNADDVGDHRPGRKAGDERGVLHPLLDAGLRKPEIRAWSKRLGLPTWDKPQLACLASRLPYGTAVTAERLDQVARAEEALSDRGLRIFRVRHHGDVARLELGEAELARVLGDAALRASLVAGVKAAGYRFVALDLEPFRSGRMNEGLGLPLPVIA
jgi:uncharacterized protein